MSTRMNYTLEQAMVECVGVAPWTVGKVFRTFHSDASRMDMLATAFLVQHDPENAGVPPARLWKSTIKEWLIVVRQSLQMTGRGGISADRRFAAVDAASDLSQVVDQSCDAFGEAELMEDFAKSCRITELVVTLLDSVQDGLGSALRDGMTMEQAAEKCGCCLRTAYYKIDAVKEMLAA